MMFISTMLLAKNKIYSLLSSPTENMIYAKKIRETVIFSKTMPSFKSEIEQSMLLLHFQQIRSNVKG